MTKPDIKKPVVKIGNAQPKTKIDRFKDRLAETTEVQDEVVQAAPQVEALYIPPAMVRKPPPAPTKKSLPVTGKLDFSTIKPPAQREVKPLFDASRYLKK